APQRLLAGRARVSVDQLALAAAERDRRGRVRGQHLVLRLGAGAARADRANHPDYVRPAVDHDAALPLAVPGASGRAKAAHRPEKRPVPGPRHSGLHPDPVIERAGGGDLQRRADRAAGPVSDQLPGLARQPGRAGAPANIRQAPQPGANTYRRRATMNTPLTLTRYAGNPILLPSLVNEWESDNVFNAAVVERDGLIVMLYRAQGLDRISRIGCAVSTDGVRFNRLKEPVFVPEADYEEFGVEDPRVTYLDGWYYMLYTGFSAQGTRVALARSRNLIGWERMGVVLPDEDNKDAALFPRKINGRYAMFHRRMPDLWIAYSD